MKNENIFGSRVRKFRTANNLTQPQLGEKIGLSKQAINDIEQGRRDTTISKVILLARLFNTTVEYLVGESDIPTRPCQASSMEAFFTDQNNAAIINRLSALCKEQNIQIKDLEDISAAGMLVYSYMNIYSLPSILALADYFDVSLDYLVGRTDKPEINR